MALGNLLSAELVCLVIRNYKPNSVLHFIVLNEVHHPCKTNRVKHITCFQLGFLASESKHTQKVVLQQNQDCVPFNSTVKTQIM